jgi:hypothetical protein
VIPPPAIKRNIGALCMMPLDRKPDLSCEDAATPAGCCGQSIAISCTAAPTARSSLLCAHTIIR